MKKLVLGALLAGLFAACGGGGNNNKVVIVGSDASTDTGPAGCNVLTQMGCNTGEKCTWIIDQSGPPQVGHVGCAANGTVAIGGACMYTMPPNGADNCNSTATAPSVCLGRVCKAICDQGGNAPMCDTQHSCQVYAGFLGPDGMEMAGVCDPLCNPIADNFYGSAARTGSACGPLTSQGAGSDTGCYGFWSSKHVTHFSCAREPMGSHTLYHRSACTTANGCGTGSGAYLNGCASGYMPWYKDYQAGQNEFVCLAICEPADCYNGNITTYNPNAAIDTAHCGAAAVNRLGKVGGRQCKTPTAGTFNGAPDGDQCVYGWQFEYNGSSNKVLKSDWTDTTGFCMDHTLYTLADQTGMMSTPTAQPACAQLPLSSAGSNCYGSASAQSPSDLTGCDAIFMGCVSTTTGSVPTMFQNNPKNGKIIRPRPPYHDVMSAPSAMN